MPEEAPKSNDLNTAKRLRGAARTIRMATGLSQQELADQLGLAVRTISRYEVDRPTGDGLLRLAHLASVQEDWTNYQLLLAAWMGEINADLRQKGIDMQLLQARWGLTEPGYDPELFTRAIVTCALDKLDDQTYLVTLECGHEAIWMAWPTMRTIPCAQCIEDWLVQHRKRANASNA